jgi:prepilin-type N-terminal cleavage/methylation domain-containing protein
MNLTRHHLNPANQPAGGNAHAGRMVCRTMEEAAFTLIEMLIAIAISAMVLSVVSLLLFSALHLRATASEAAAETLPVDHAIEVIKRDLLGIVPVGVLAGPMGNDAVPVGMTQPLILEIFTASSVIDSNNPWSDVQKIDYSLAPPTNRYTSAGMSLMRGVTHNLLAVNQVAPVQQALLQDVQTLKFTYYDGTNWNDTWSTTLSNIPLAIRVSLDFVQNRNEARVKPHVQFTVPVVTFASTNSITNQMSGN